MELPYQGRYLLTFSLSTRTCGNFELCSPTEVAVVMNGAKAIRRYETGAADKRRNDFEAVRDMMETGFLQFQRTSRKICFLPALCYDPGGRIRRRLLLTAPGEDGQGRDN